MTMIGRRAGVFLALGVAMVLGACQGGSDATSVSETVIEQPLEGTYTTRFGSIFPADLDESRLAEREDLTEDQLAVAREQLEFLQSRADDDLTLILTEDTYTVVWPEGFPAATQSGDLEVVSNFVTISIGGQPYDFLHDPASGTLTYDPRGQGHAGDEDAVVIVFTRQP